MKKKHFLMFILFILSMIGSTSSLHAQVPAAPPVAEIIGEVDVSVTSARVTGRIDPKGGNVNVSFEYGIANDDRTATFTLSAIPIPQDVSGDTPVDVTAELPGLSQGTSYKVRIRAQGTAGMDFSDEKFFRIPFLSSLDRGEIPPRPAADKTFTVNIKGTPSGRWRFVGSLPWNLTGEAGKAVNLVSGKRDVEFIPVADFIHPATVSVDVGDGDGQTMTLDRSYFTTPTQNGGSIQIIIKPDHIASTDRPVKDRAQWKFLTDKEWRNSHKTDEKEILKTGGYEVIFKGIGDYDKPANLSILISPDSGEVSRTITYITNEPFDDRVSIQPKPVDNNSVVANEEQYRYLGIVRSKVGAGTGFVVHGGVVATASHVIFDDIEFKFKDELQWLFQRVSDQVIENGYFPAPQKPRGYYALSGYAAARQNARDNDPLGYVGKGTPESQGLDFAALWFAGEDAGRGGYLGYLASDEGDENGFLNSGKEKILAGFPAAGAGFEGYVRGKYHAVEFTTALQTSSSGLIWATKDAQGYSGMSGGPLFVRHTNGLYYPAAIYLGGSNQTIVRAINTDVVRLFRLARDSSFSEKQNVSGGGTVDGGEINGKEILRNIKVIIEPSEAREKLAKWSLVPDPPFRVSGGMERGMKVGEIYQMKFSEIAGFPIPGIQHVKIMKNPENVQEEDYVYTYTYLPSLESWRQTHFGENIGDAADEKDPDKDGQNNIQEYTAGTDPVNNTDFLKIDTINISENTFTVTCAWKQGRIYKLQRNKNPEKLDEWETKFTGLIPNEDMNNITLKDTAAPSERAFYRIEVSFNPPE